MGFPSENRKYRLENLIVMAEHGLSRPHEITTRPLTRRAWVLADIRPLKYIEPYVKNREVAHCGWVAKMWRVRVMQVS